MVFIKLINSISRYSLKHVLDEHLHSLNSADSSSRVEFGKICGVLSAEVLMNEFSVSLVLDVELSSLEVVELVVLEHLSWDALASEEPDSLDIKEFAIGLLCYHCVGEGVRSEFVLASLDEHVKEILGLKVLNVVLIIIAFILNEIDSVTFRIVILPKSLHSISRFLVAKVNEVRLEFRKNELSRW
jgi:hypothetical protein